MQSACVWMCSLLRVRTQAEKKDASSQIIPYITLPCLALPWGLSGVWGVCSVVSSGKVHQQAPLHLRERMNETAQSTKSKQCWQKLHYFSIGAGGSCCCKWRCLLTFALLVRWAIAFRWLPKRKPEGRKYFTLRRAVPPAVPPSSFYQMFIGELDVLFLCKKSHRPIEMCGPGEVEESKRVLTHRVSGQ